MRWPLLLVSMSPLVAYAIVAGRSHRAAVGLAVAVGVVECAGASLVLGFLDPVSTTSLVLLVICGVISLAPSRELWFRFQPVALNVLLALALWVHDSVSAEPLLPWIAEHALHLQEGLPPYQHGYVQVYATTLSRSLPYWLILHGVCTAWAALTLSRWSWLAVRVLGFYAGLVALFLGERLMRLS